VYYTFARTLPPSSKVSKSVVALLLYFKWTKFIIVAGKRPAWGSEVQEAMKVRNSGFSWRKNALKLSRAISHVKFELKTNVSDICAVPIIRFDVGN
jgi:hypothetical protein